METLTLTNLLNATNGRVRPSAIRNRQFVRIATDSRQVEPGDLFWALSGNRFDGHDFVREATRRGAAACVVNRNRVARNASVLVEVTDTLTALWELARWYRRRQPARVIGVTGSVGKTTTREMIHSVLKQSYVTACSPKNYNNEFGVPLSLLQIEQRHDYAIVELAASHAGEIEALADLAGPEIGVVTGIGPAHLAGFGSIAQVAAAKGELLAALPKAGVAVLAGDDARLRRLAERARCPVQFVGENANNDLTATDIDSVGNTLRFRVDTQRYELNVVGRHHVVPALAAIAVGRMLGVPEAQMASGLEQFRPVPGRCLPRRIGPWTVIDDTYNANPLSFHAACQALADWDTGHTKWLVTGDMLELGARASEYHAELGRMAAEARVDYLLAVGEYAKDVIAGARDGGMKDDRAVACTSRSQLIEILGRRLESGDVLLVKGSRSTQMERVIDELEVKADTYLEAVG